MVKFVSASNEPHYSLKKIKKFISNGDFLITNRAKNDAKNDFGWDLKAIKNAILSLQKKHFHKSKENWDDPSIYVDYYKARGLMGENVYLHFHVEKNKLIINSFKEI